MPPRAPGRLAPLLACLVLAVACEAPDAPPPAAEGEGEGEGEGEREAVGEACGDAIVLDDGVGVTGTTVGAADDVALGCNGGGADRVYRIDLAAESHLRIDAYAQSVGTGIAVGVLAATCTADAVQTCQQIDDATELVADLPVLPAGSYFVVVEGVGGSVDYALTATVSPAVCVGDGLDGFGVQGVSPDGDGTPQTATYLGGGNVDSAVDVAPVVSVDLTDTHLCPHDVDTFLFAHAGGALDVEASVAPGRTAPTLRITKARVDSTAFLKFRDIRSHYVPFVLGDDGPVDVATAVAPGFYLATLTEQDANAAEPTRYRVRVQHACELDAADSPLASLDDSALATTGRPAQFVTADLHAADAIHNRICGGNDDAIVFSSPDDATLSVHVTGANLELAWSTVPVPADGEPAPIEAPLAVTESVSGDRHDISVAVDKRTRALLRIRQVTRTDTTVPYTVTADFTPATSDVGTCASPRHVDAPQAETTIFHGDNLTATAQVDGVCNGDRRYFNEPALRSFDALYAWTTTATADVDVELQHDTSSGTVTLYAAPDGACPADLSTLVPIRTNGAPRGDGDDDVACGAHIRIAQLPPGNYFVVVEGHAGFHGGIGGHSSTTPPLRGSYDVVVRTAPGGFARAQACVEAETIALAPTTTTYTIEPGDWSAQSGLSGPNRGFVGEPDFGGCSGGSLGVERAFTFTAADDAFVTFATDPGRDTVVYVRTDACDDLAATELGCNDDVPDGTGARQSLLQVRVFPGTTYFVVVDTFAPEAPGETHLTVTKNVLPTAMSKTASTTFGAAATVFNVAELCADANEDDTLSVTLLGGITQRGQFVYDELTRAVSYTPAPDGDDGQDVMYFTCSDGSASSAAAATISITVTHAG